MRRGATFETAPALAVESRDKVQVRTSAGALEDDVLIIAAGSWSSTIGGITVPREAIKPVRGQLLQLRLPRRPAERIIWSDGCYLVPWRDGAVLVGATVEDVGFDEHATVDGMQRLLQAAVALMPSLGEAQLDEIRVGLRPATADELPAVGASSTMPHVFYATGHYRNGILLAPLTARLVADLVLDGKTDGDLATLRPERLGL